MLGEVHRDPRIIPACAGSTPDLLEVLHPAKDHPRVRGEHLRFRAARELDKWIIPACAGSTAAPLPAGACTTDHPRVRGEHAPGSI